MFIKTKSLLLMSGVFTAALISIPNDASAKQEYLYSANVDENVADKDWSVTVGVGALYLPEYEGGDEYEVMPLPSLSIRYKDRVELGRDGLTVDVIKHEGFTAGVGVGVDTGRDADDADRLNGLGDVDATAEGKLYAEYQLGLVNSRVTFAQDLGDGHDGFTVEGTVGGFIPVPVGDRMFALMPSVSTTYASENYNESYFGVNSRQSARSGLSQYSADAGFKDVSAGLVARYSINDHWTLNAITRYSLLIGDAADSPIVEDENQLSGGLFLSYTF